MTVIPIDRAQTVTDLKGKVQVLMSNGMTQANIAEKTGISPASLSKWLNGKSTGNDDSIVFALTEWIAEKEANCEEAIGSAATWIETPTATSIFTVIRYTDEHRNIGLVYGGAGLGKTVTAKEYASEQSNVWIATMTPASANISACLRRIANAVGLDWLSHRNSEVEQDLIAHLNETNGLLIVDEAQHLRIPALETIRSLHDASGVAVVLMGNSEINKGLVGPHNDKFAQLTSRIGHKLNLAHPKDKDVSVLSKAWGVSDRPAVKELQSIGRGPGGLRAVSQVLNMAAFICDGDGAKIDLPTIRGVWGNVSGNA